MQMVIEIAAELIDEFVAIFKKNFACLTSPNVKKKTA